MKEELKGVNEQNIDTNSLVEVKTYKKANDKLLNKVLVGLSAILIAVLIYGNLHGCSCYKQKADESAPSNTIGASVTKTTPAPVVTPEPTNNTGNGGQGGPTETETTVTPEPTTEPTTNPCDPEAIEESWVTEELPKEETVTFAYYDAAEEREDELTKADKAYIEEYMDYYGISYEDARVSYMQFGPLSIPTEESYEYSDEVEYETRYVFDADDLAAINLYVSELGMSRAEAENYYVTVVAPEMGKLIATEIVMLQK